MNLGQDRISGGPGFDKAAPLSDPAPFLATVRSACPRSVLLLSQACAGCQSQYVAVLLLRRQEVLRRFKTLSVSVTNIGSALFQANGHTGCHEVLVWCRWYCAIGTLAARRPFSLFSLSSHRLRAPETDCDRYITSISAVLTH
ncbi:hypothetical protein PAXRUDRAFT_297809 [Paxillus rubicundulus Ve08.2h10]|uniref:Uncharacterized protein n=1 Tax=Paxillus rubicundulus Ve08.2h10 TaxID=930991 RepID=A0A0D0CUC8_9AGAM|nr:hypothetical protein PAXRUDRAFT_297809 [Paxillus rubicundulus Ve08.2h10]